MARHTTIVEAELLGHDEPVAGRLDVTGGGVAFLPCGPRGGFAISTRGLTRVGRLSPASADLAVEGDGARHVLRMDAAAAAAFVAALAGERRAAGVPEVALGPSDRPRRRPGPPPADGGPPTPTPAERGGLSAASLPGLWLRLTAGANRRLCRHTDGMAMMLELALCGAIDAPNRREITLHPRPTGDPAADGALERLLDRDVVTDPPPYTASWLGTYVGLLDVDPSQAAMVRTQTREAFEEGPAHPRAALLVWLVKQDYVFRRVAFPMVFDGGAWRGRRLMRRARPSIHVGDDREATMRAHRMLAATIVQPPPCGC